MADFTEDDGFKAGFSCQSAMSFAKGIPLLNNYYDLDSMTVTDITASGVKVFLMNGKLATKEIIPDKFFLFSSEKEMFILNLEFKSDKRDGYFLQLSDQYCEIHLVFLNKTINGKKQSKPSSKYYTLMTKNDLFPDLYNFIVSTADTAWNDYDWEKKTTHTSLMIQKGPARRYLGMVDINRLTPKRIKRFGREMQSVISFSQAKGNDQKIKHVQKKYSDVLDDMDVSTSLMILAILGPDFYEAALKSKLFNLKEDSKGMLKLYFDNAKIEYYESQMKINYSNGVADGKAKGFAEGTAKGIAEGTAKGFAEGTAKTNTRVAKDMLKKGFDLQTIADISTLPKEQVRSLAAEMNGNTIA